MNTRIAFLPFALLASGIASADAVSAGWTATSGTVTLSDSSRTGVTATGTNINSGIYTNLFEDGSSYTLALGETLTLSATVTFGGSLASASEQSGAFRFGLYDSSASAGTTGWSGYFALADTAGTNGTAGGLYERNGSAQDYWSGTGGTRLSTYVSSEPALETGAYQLRMSLTRTESGMQIEAMMYLLSNPSRILISDTRTDTTSPTVRFDRFGIYSSDRLAPETIAISAADLSVVPEPGFAWAALALPVSACLRRRRRR